MKEQEQLLEIINRAVSEIHYPHHPAGLYEPIQYIMSLGGKRVRPLLTLLSTSLFSAHVDAAVKPAIGIELFHNFTLLHDDLMDQAVIRRNQPTVHIKWNPNTAILSGDAMQIMAYQLMAASPAAYLKEVIELFSKTALEICEGQQLDMEFESRLNVTQEEYLEMIRLKTAVLLGCALKIGALIGGASKTDSALLYQFGENIGLAFQLKDDLLDVYGDPNLFGKNIGGDICSNKKTFLLIDALNSASQKEREELEQWIALKQFDTVEKIALFTHLYSTTGARKACEAKMEHYFTLGMEALKRVDLPDEKKTQLTELATQLMYRES